MLQLTSFICKFFPNSFPCFSSFFSLLFLVNLCLILIAQPCMECIPIFFLKMPKNDKLDRFLRFHHSRCDPSPSLSMQMQEFKHPCLCMCTYQLQTPQVFEIALRDGGFHPVKGNRKFCWRDIFIEWWESEEECLDDLNIFQS